MAISTIGLEELLYKYRWQVVVFLIGVSMIGFGVLFSVNNGGESESVQVLTASETGEGKLVVEVSGAVKSPGVYELGTGSRVEDAISAAGGFFNEDKTWVEQSINRAAKVTDGQKLYIRSVDEVGETLAETSGLININTASASELESLWGIGPVYAQNIIDHRPYSNLEELIANNIIKQNVYDRNKDKLTVY